MKGRYVETQYLDYQERYAVEPRRADVRLIEFIARECDTRPPDRRLKLLDIGCSSGNLLHHLRNRLPHLQYAGADVFPSIIERCSENPRLAGIDFHVLDVRKFDKFPSSFDFVTVNAVLHRFDRATLVASLKNIANTLVPDGVLYLFEFCHEFRQNIVIDERQLTHPEGARLHIWSKDEFDAILSEAGLSRGQYSPFEIDIDLPRPTQQDDMTTYTVNTVEGGRLQFRGSLLMPWCHIVCRRA